MSARLPQLGLALGTGVLALTLVGCSSTPPADSADSADGGRISVVASTDVYGDIAARIGGNAVDVTSIISEPGQDPHSYEADARVQLALSKADIVLQNGGGYDDFMDVLLSGADNEDATVLNASDISGYDQDPEDGEFNEHLWYDMPTVEKVADELVTAFAAADPASSSTFEENGSAFADQVQELIDQEAAIASAHQGKGVAITEPVPVYLLEASGLVVKTPDAFSEAIEEGSDVAPAVMQETLALFSDGTVSMLAYNEQTAGPQTDLLREAAEEHDIPVVSVYETLPDGEDYYDWVSATLDEIAAALDR